MEKLICIQCGKEFEPWDRVEDWGGLSMLHMRKQMYVLRNAKKNGDLIIVKNFVINPHKPGR